MESAIDQTYDKFESQFSDEVWWKEAKDRGLGFKDEKLKQLDAEVFETISESFVEPTSECEDLIARGATCDFVDASGNCALHLIAQRGYTELLEIFVEKFPNEIYRKNALGQGLLVTSLNSFQKSVWEFLIQKKIPNVIKAALETTNVNLVIYFNFLGENINFGEAIGEEFQKQFKSGSLDTLNPLKLRAINDQLLKSGQCLSQIVAQYCIHESIGDLPLSSASNQSSEFESESRQIIDSLTQENKTLRAENIELKDVDAQLKSEIETLGNSIQKLTDDSTELINSNEEISIENSRIKKAHEELLKENYELNNEIETFKDSANDTAQNELIENLKNQLKEAQDSNESLLSSTKQLETENKDLREKTEHLSNDISKLEKLSEEFSEFKKSTAELNEEFKNSKKRTSQLESQIEMSKKSYIDMTMQLSEMKDENNELDAKLEKVTEERNILRSSYKDSEEKLKDLSEKLAMVTSNQDAVLELTNEIDRLKELEKDQKDQIEALNCQKSEFECEIENLKSDAKETDEKWREEMNNAVENLKIKIQDLESENLDLKSESADQVAELKNPELEDLLQNANSQILELKQANEILSENLQATEDERSAIYNEFQSSIAEKDQQISNLKNDLEKLGLDNNHENKNDAVLADAKIELKNLSEEKAALSNSYETLHSQYSELRIENSKIQDQLTDIQNQKNILIGQNEGLTDENDLLNRTVQDFRAANSALDEKIENISNTCSQLETENSALKARLLKTVNEGFSSVSSEPTESKPDDSAASAALVAENEKLLQNNLNLASEMQKINAENETLMDENQVLKKYLDDINLLSSQLHHYTRLK